MIAEIHLDEGIVTRNDILKGVLKLDDPFEVQGQLKLIWTDSFGRTVAVETQTLNIASDSIPFEISLSRGVTLQNFLEAEFTFGHWHFIAPKKEFIITPEPSKLDDYEIIMYFPYRSELQNNLRKAGITAGQIQSKSTYMHPERARIWWENNYRYYCDQIAIDYYAAYHTPMQIPKHKLLAEAKELYKADRSDKQAFFRKPCFHDSEATAEALKKVRKAVETQMRFKPLFYSTDEVGVADLVSAWDFCFDPRTLTAMREWLMEQYGSLEALNEEWGTNFTSLDEVTPFTTDEMLARGDNNLAPWADHRFFMNKTFADALLKATEQVHALDPDALAGIGGGQMPCAFGGYDYWLLSQVLDVIEPYNIGNNREIWRSFVPHKPAVTTSFGSGKREIWRLWYQALHGDRGIIIYDEKGQYLDEHGNLTEIAKGAAPTYKELTGGIVRQLAHADKVYNPVGVHYSQASMTAHWMFEIKASGKDWVNRGSATERLQSEFLRLRETYTKLMEDNLAGYDFVAYGQLENGDFEGMNKKIMFLPQSMAMSDTECKVLRQFVEKGGILVADCYTALMDNHCKMLDHGQMDDLFGIERTEIKLAPGPMGLEPVKDLDMNKSWAKGLLSAGRLEKVCAAEPSIRLLHGAVALYRDANGTPAVIVNEYGAGKTIYLNAVFTDYHRWRMKPPEGESLRRFWGEIIKVAGVSAPYAVTRADGTTPEAVELFPFDFGSAHILGVHRNYQTRVSELGPPEYQSQDDLEKEVDLTVDLGREYHVYETRAGKYLGKMQRVNFTLNPWQPMLLTMLETPVGSLEIAGPSEAEKGDLVEVKFTLGGAESNSAHTFRTTLIGPDGSEIELLSSNILAPHGKADWSFPLAVSDPAGEYTLCVKDVITGTVAEHKINVL